MIENDCRCWWGMQTYKYAYIYIACRMYIGRMHSHYQMAVPLWNVWNT